MITLNVFCDEKGEYGNPVGIIEDLDKKIDNSKRQEMAKKSGFSEIVFVNDFKTFDVSIFSPQSEFAFAGHALIGVAYYLNKKLKKEIKEIVSMVNVIHTYQKDGLTWVRGELSILPDWNFEELNSPAEVENITSQTSMVKKHTFVWSYVDQEKGVIRARTFASDWDILEDEANGSGSMILAHKLDKNLIICHGKGSVIYARPFDPTHAEVGGLVR